MKIKLILLLLILLYFFLNLYCVFNESPVWDEPLQLTVGQMFWQTKEFILEPVEPPFARIFTALPVFLFGERLMAGTLGKIYFFPRLMVILTGCFFLIFFYKVLKKLFNEELAILGVILFIFEPNLLTHSHYNTTDFIFTVLFFISIYLLRKKSVFLPIILALLFATKINGPVIFLFTTILIIISILCHSRDLSRVLSRESGNLFKLFYRFRIKSGMTLRRLFIFLLIFFLAFWSCYLFKTDPAIGKNTEAVGKPYLFYLFENKPFWLKVFKTPLPLIDYLATLKYAVSYQKAGFDSYFSGHYSRYGWWWYFPVIFLLKTPLPLLVLFFAGIFFLFINCHPEFISGSRQNTKKMLKPAPLSQGGQVQHDTFVCVIPIISTLFLSLFVRINIGLRHILPIYPFLIIIAVFGFKYLWNKRKMGKVVSVGLLLWYILRTIYFLPHPITFTNEFLPPDKSYKVLADSNLSWGQELLTIRRWQKSTNQQINLFYFGNVKAENYLTDFTQWGCDDYQRLMKLIKTKQSPTLVSATCLQKMAAHNDKKILKIKPKEIITNSILVY